MIADERQEPLADVEVFVPEFNLSSSTDRHGVFTLFNFTMQREK